MKRVVFDLETNGLLEQVTCIHSLVLRDLDTDEVMSCADQPGYRPIYEGLRMLAKAERIYGHNIIQYDLQVLQKLHGIPLPPMEKVRDTKVIAQMRWAHMKAVDLSRKKDKLPPQLIGKHSLEAWGYRLGILKGDYKASKPGDDVWATWNKQMQDYCEQDTAVTAALVRHIQQSGVSPESVETEQELALYLFHQEQNGWPFNLEKAAKLDGLLTARREELGQALRATFKPWVRPVVKKGVVEVFTPKASRPVVNRLGIRIPMGPYTKIERVEFNPGSRAHIANRLITLYGWKPTEFTPTGEPEINEKTLSGLPKGIPGVELLQEYLLVGKRLGQLSEGKQAWLQKTRKDHPRGGKLTGCLHIHHAVLQSGTVTHRGAHIQPNLGQVPAVGSPYGAECRELFEVPEGWAQVGADASSLEGRCGAHYTQRFDGGSFGKLILGGDIHNHNRDLLARVSGKAVTRGTAKTWFYAFLYGAGDEKLGRTVDPSLDAVAARKLGAKLRKHFLASLPGLKGVVDVCKERCKTQGWVTGIDGRRVYTRSEHSALNTLLQSAGAIICKRWIVAFNRRLTAEFGPQGWDGKWAALGWIHDEVQLAVRPEIAERVAAILVEEIERLTQHFNWRVQLTGEAKIGLNWKETH